MGKPLIASNIPGCKEIIDNGVNGYLFEVQNVDDLEKKVEKFLTKTEEERIKLGKESRKKAVREFDRNKTIMPPAAPSEG